MMGKSRKWLTVISLLVITTVMLAACAPAATPAPAAPADTAAPAAPAATVAPAAPAAATHKVAMVTSGPTNDHGWNQNALQGVQRIHDKLGWEMAYSESVAAAQQQNVLRQYAQQGYDLIFAHGYEYGDALKAVAPDFPKTMFVQINATTDGANIVGTNFKFGELGYFAGMAAGLVTKNNKIGIVAAQDAPQVTADSDNIKVGAKAVNPNADVNVSFVGSWDDVVKGQQVTQAQIDRGVDVLVIMGDSFTPPAIKLAQSKGIKVIGGWSGDNYDLAPDTIITSGVQDVPSVYMDIAQQYSDGTLKGGTTFLSGFKEKTQLMGKWGDFVTQDVKDKVNNAVADYLAGKLDIGVK
jgi:basic membrane lipoprotein Med (substrate-binding protein (PBP1-ABC) superfamily)